MIADQPIVLTGAASGIGDATARRLRVLCTFARKYTVSAHEGLTTFRNSVCESTLCPLETKDSVAFTKLLQNCKAL